MIADALHVARLAAAHSAALALYVEAQNDAPFDAPDAVTVRLEATTPTEILFTVTYSRNGLDVSEESV